MKGFRLSPPSTSFGTILILLVLIGLGLLDTAIWLLISLSIIGLFAGLAVRGTFATVRNRKGVWIFFVLTGASLLWTEEGRLLAPILITKMLSMWLWVVVWINWVGFEQIILTLARLGMPPILLHITAFTARFLPILSQRLRMMLAAQASRGARKGISPQQLHNLAGGLGSLFLSSFEQSEVVECAMQSRGFCGALPLLVEDNDTPAPYLYNSLVTIFIFGTIVWTGVIREIL